MPMTREERATRRAQRQRERERLVLVMAAAADERERFNAAIQTRGCRPTLATAFGPYQVLSVDSEWWYHCIPQGATTTSAFYQRSFCGANDGAWADLLRQMGVARHALFAPKKVR